MDYKTYLQGYLYKQASGESIPDTKKHIREVQDNLKIILGKLKEHMQEHDASKLVPPESSMFDKAIPVLEKAKEDSREYKDAKELVDKAWAKHYKVNSHHPQYHTNGVDDMCLVCIIEMLCDWITEAKIGEPGEETESFDEKCKKYKVSDQLKKILKNTAKSMGKKLN